MPYVETEPGDLPENKPRSGVAALVEQQEQRLSKERIWEKQIDYLAARITELEERMPSAQEREWLQQRTKDAQNLEWMRSKIKSHIPWLLPVAGVIGAAFVWFASNTISIVGKQ
jgi:hypothetical protein